MGEPVRRADDERVEGVLRVQVRVGRLRPLGGRSSRAAGVAACGLSAVDLQLLARRLAHRGLDELEEVAADPGLGEVVGSGDREGVVGELDPASFPEPGLVGGLVERLPQARRNFAPEACAVRSNWRSIPLRKVVPAASEAAILAPSTPLLNVDTHDRNRRKQCRFAGIYTHFTVLSTDCGQIGHNSKTCAPSGFFVARACGKRPLSQLVYTDSAPRRRGAYFCLHHLL